MSPVSNLEQKLKNQIGELVFTITVLQEQLEQANEKIAELQPKPDDKKDKK